MAPSNLDKAVADRESNNDLLLILEREINDDVHTPLEEPSVNQLLSLLKTVQVDIFEIHKRVQLCIPADMTPHVTEFGKQINRSNKVLNGLTGIKNRFAPASTSTAHGGGGGGGTRQEMKLTPLELPTFNGNLHQWVSFRDLFTNAIHNKTNLSKSEKLIYLKSLVKGDAARLIQTLVVTDANYDIAWNKLVDRYQNERELVFSIFDRFISQQNVVSNSASSLRELIDTTVETTRSLEVFQIPLDKGMDAFFLFLVLRKLDSSAKQLWEQQVKDSKVPSLQSLLDFLEQRARALHSSSSGPSDQTRANQHSHKQGFQRTSTNQNRNVAHLSNTSSNCKVCNSSPHALYKCSKFISLSVPERVEAIKRSRCCFNCLQDNHSVSQCSSSKACKTCNGKHHTMIHRTKPVDTKATDSTVEPLNLNHLCVVEQPATTSSNEEKNLTLHHHTLKGKQYDTILATVLVSIPDHLGNHHLVRVLADGGSNTNYITESCARKLQLKKKRCNTSSSGLGGEKIISSQESALVNVSPHFDQTISFIMKSLIVPTITCNLPQVDFDTLQWSHLQNLKLADPTWHESKPVDMLLGAEFFFSILEVGKKAGPAGSPSAMNSSFGWLIGGGSRDLIPTDSYHFTALTINCDDDNTNKESTNESLDQTIRKFWEIEEMPTVKFLTPSEQVCEDHFKQTHQRDNNGRFIVQIPWKSPRPKIGDSRKLAERSYN